MAIKKSLETKCTLVTTTMSDFGCNFELATLNDRYDQIALWTPFQSGCNNNYNNKTTRRTYSLSIQKMSLIRDN